MSTITGATFNNIAPPSNKVLHLNVPTQPTKAEADSTNTVAPSTPQAVNVSLSSEGLQASASAKHTKASVDVDQEKILEKIRQQMKELQKAIQEQQAQLQAVQASHNLSNEEKAQRISAINQQLANLNSSLAGATAQLLQALKGLPELAGSDGIQPMPYVKPASDDTASQT
jgi:predicted phage tail protein